MKNRCADMFRRDRERERRINMQEEPRRYQPEPIVDDHVQGTCVMLVGVVVLLLKLLFVADAAAKAPPPRGDRLSDSPEAGKCALDGNWWVVWLNSSRSSCAGKFVGDWDGEDQEERSRDDTKQQT